MKGKYDRMPLARMRGGGRVGGSALIVVLWVIGLMGMLVASFAFDAHLESRITSYYRKRTRAVSLAQSGIEIAKLLMAKSAKIDPRAPETAENADDRWFEPARTLASGQSFSGSFPLGEGDVLLQIVTEQARRSVNHLKKEEEWEPVLDVVGVPEDSWPDLIEAFLDWTDADDDARTDGAETEDYYHTLEPPYRARNGDLYAVEELLLIKGFKRAIVYGGVLESDDDHGEPLMIADGGLSRLLTVFGDQKVNVNAAPYEVLMTLPALRADADLVANDIVEERASLTNINGKVEDNFFKDDQDMYGRLPALNDAERREYVTTASSKYYRITASGRVNNVEHTIACIVQNDGNALTFLRWIEEN